MRAVVVVGPVGAGLPSALGVTAGPGAPGGTTMCAPALADRAQVGPPSSARRLHVGVRRHARTARARCGHGATR